MGTNKKLIEFSNKKLQQEMLQATSIARNLQSI